MFGTRQVSARVGGRSIFVLSVLALLALACFPVLAHADSSEKQYTDAPPTVTGTTTNHSEAPAKKSTAHNGGGSTSEGEDHGKHSHSSEGNRAGGGSPGSGDGTGSGGGQSGAPKSGGHGSSSPAPHTSGATPASSKSDDGSSPLVPILIAIAVLAAISIGAVVFRQRRRRGSPGSPVSPEAG